MITIVPTIDQTFSRVADGPQVSESLYEKVQVPIRICVLAKSYNSIWD